MRWFGRTPSAISPLATRFVSTSNSTKLVWRPSNSRAMASPRVFASSRTMSARFAGRRGATMFSSRMFFVERILAASGAKDNGRLGFESATALRSRGTILFVLRLDLFARLLPVLVAPVAQLVEIAAHGERLAAVHRNGLAVDPVTAAGNQEHGQILQFLHLADPTHRIHGLGPRAGFVAWLDALAHAFGWNFARRDRVQSDAVASPFGRERHCHGVHGGFAHGGRYYIGAPIAHPGNGNRDHIAAQLARDPASG